VSESPRRPRLSRDELLAMSRMLRLYLRDDKFFNPLVAMDTKRLAEQAMEKIETSRKS
jgi:hypothetical protein